MFQRTRRFGVQILNKLFLRSTVHETLVEVREIGRMLDTVSAQNDTRDEVIKEMRKTLSRAVIGAEQANRARVGAMSGVEQAVEALGVRLSAQQADLNRKIEDRVGMVRDRLELLAGTLDMLHAHQAEMGARIGAVSKSLESTVSESRELILQRMRSFARSLNDLERRSFRQHEARDQLAKVLTTRHALPYTRGWTASPDLLIHLFDLVRQRKPQLILELGSGISSLVMADALRQNGKGRLRSFDHDATYAALTRDLLVREDLESGARIDHVPLIPWKPAAPTDLGETWEWYDLPVGLRRLPKIDLFVVDGPPGGTCDFARYPAVPALIHRLAPGGMIVADDTIRKDETRIVEAWRDQFDLELTFLTQFEKGLAVLTRRNTGA